MERDQRSQAVGHHRPRGAWLWWLWGGVAACVVVACTRAEEWQPEGVGEFRDVALYWSVADPSTPSVAASAAQWCGAVEALARYGEPTTKAGTTPATTLERAVRDLNVFLVHTSLGDRDVRYFYFDGLAQADGTPDPACFPLQLTHLYNGSYRVYALANNGVKLYPDPVGPLNKCAWSEEQIKGLSSEPGKGFLSADEGLLMSTMPEGGAAPVMDLTAGNPSTFAYEMRLVRRVARLYVRYENNDPTFVARRLEMHRIPQSISPFDPDALPTRFGLVEVASYPASGGGYGPIYVLENRPPYSGSSLSTAQERTGDVAPAQASYWFVDGDCGALRTGFQMYVFDPNGERPLEDFSIHGNRTYDYRLTIQGHDLSDQRVSTFFSEFKNRQPAGSGVLTQEVEVIYDNQFQNNFVLYYVDNTSLSVSNPHTLKVEYKYKTEPDTDYRLLTEKRPVPIGSADLSSETIKLTLRVTYQKGGVGRIVYMVNVLDKYERSASKVEEI